MADHRITFRIPPALAARLGDRSRLKRQTPSAIVRVALENYLGQPTTYELAKAAGLIGCVRHEPKDLSANSRHFGGFGKRNS